MLRRLTISSALILLPAVALGQSAVPVGPPAGAMGGGGGAMAVPGFRGSGLGNPAGGDVYMPGVVPTFASQSFNPQIGTGVAGGGGGGGGNPLGAFAAMCAYLGSALMTNTTARGAATDDFGEKLSRGAYDSMDENGYDYPNGTNRDAWRGLGLSYNKSLNGACQQKFITKDGKLGKWGMHIHGQVMATERPYLADASIPRDMDKYCPKFRSFSPDARARFYTYLFMTMADPESSCNPQARGQGPNGVAIGLFQLETKTCIPLGVRTDSAGLLEPYNNMTCAVRRLAKEINERGTILSPTSRGFGGTYWAPLRSDIQRRLASGNSMARNDTRASRKFQDLLDEFKECHSGENPNNNPNQNVGSFDLDEVDFIWVASRR